jgi:PPM family protein phosphatase
MEFLIILTVVVIMTKKIIHYSYKSNTGRLRNNNEDSAFAYYKNNIGLFIVADGIGGYRAGEIASKMAVNTVSENVIERVFDTVKSQDSKYSIGEETVYNIITSAFSKASKKIRSEGKRDTNLYGMGTTIALALTMEDEYNRENRRNYLYVASLGDSRVYLVTNKIDYIRYASKNVEKENINNNKRIKMEIIQLTKQHDFFTKAEVIENNLKTGRQPKYPLTEYLGKPNSSEAYYSEMVSLLTKVKWNEDDYLLLCTDGLTDMLDDSDICSTIEECEDKIGFKKDHDFKFLLDEICESLIKKANEKGGYDNITVVLARQS